LFCFRKIGEVVQGVVPELVEECFQFRKRFRPGLVQVPGAVAPFGNEARRPQDLQVLRDCGAADIELPGDLAGRQFAFTDQLEDFAPPWFGDGFENVLHWLERKYRLTQCQGSVSPLLRLNVNEIRV